MWPWLCHQLMLSSQFRFKFFELQFTNFTFGWKISIKHIAIGKKTGLGSAAAASPRQTTCQHELSPCNGRAAGEMEPSGLVIYLWPLRDLPVDHNLPVGHACSMTFFTCIILNHRIKTCWKGLWRPSAQPSAQCRHIQHLTGVHLASVWKPPMKENP